MNNLVFENYNDPYGEHRIYQYGLFGKNYYVTTINRGSYLMIFLDADSYNGDIAHVGHGVLPKWIVMA